MQFYAQFDVHVTWSDLTGSYENPDDEEVAETAKRQEFEGSYSRNYC